MKLALKDKKLLASLSNTTETNSGKQNSVNETNCAAAAAVAAVAAVVGAVVYVLFVLEAVAFWTDVGVDWDDGPAVALLESARSTNLIREQMIDQIAQNFKK